MTPLNHSLHVAVPTAFDHAERLDTKRTIAHILQLQKQGIKSVLVCGSTGEQHSLTLTEKKQLLHALAQETSWAADFEVLFGLAGIVFHETLALAEAVSKNTPNRWCGFRLSPLSLPDAKGSRALCSGIDPYLRKTSYFIQQSPPHGL